MAHNGSMLDRLEAALPRDQLETLRALADATEGASDTAGRIAGNVREVSEHFAGAARATVRERPVAAILTAVGVGFVLGVLWKA